MTVHTPSSTQDTNAQRGAPDRSPRAGSGLRECVIAFLLAVVLSAPILGAGGVMCYHGWAQREVVRVAAIEAALAYERLLAASPGPMLPAGAAAHGRDLFASACVACHGPTGTGAVGLGRNLVESDFTAGNDDASLQYFLTTGRPDAKPLAMPPKGGRSDLTDADLADIVVYLRGLQDPRRMPALPAPVAAAVVATAEDKAKALAAAGGDTELAGYIAHGSKLFHTTCIACHGPGGVGIKGNGKPLVKNDLVKSFDDDALLAFIKKGRDPSDPKNTTGIGMPAKGGNPALSDDDLLDVISYLRTLQAPDARAAGDAR